MKEILKEFIIDSWVKSGASKEDIHTFIKQSLDTNTLGVLFGNIPMISLMVPAAAGGLMYFASHPNYDAEQAMKRRRDTFQMAIEDLGVDEMEREKKNQKPKDGKLYQFTG